MQAHDLQPVYSILRVDAYREVHYSISGQLNDEAAHKFMTELGEAALPFVSANQSWYVLGDLSGLVAQEQATALTMGKRIEMAKNHGMVRLALVNASPLVLMQHRRVAGDANVESFESKHEGLGWLRADRS